MGNMELSSYHLVPVFASLSRTMRINGISSDQAVKV